MVPVPAAGGADLWWLRGVVIAGLAAESSFGAHRAWHGGVVASVFASGLGDDDAGCRAACRCVSPGLPGIGHGADCSICG